MIGVKSTGTGADTPSGVLFELGCFVKKMFSTFNSLITSLYPTAPSRASVLKEEAMESDVEALRKSFASDGQGSVMSAPVTSDDEGVSVQTRSSGGRKRCLFIGINYFGQRNELRGCIADAYNLKSFLSSTYAIPNTDDCMRLLTDEPFHQGTSSYPTRDNILEALCWLVKGAQPGDSLFLHYSGHGGLRKTASTFFFSKVRVVFKKTSDRRNGIDRIRSNHLSRGLHSNRSNRR